MEGAFEAIKTVYADINRADEHQDRWGKKCHERNLVVSAEECTRATGSKPDVGDLTPEQGTSPR